MHIVCLHGSPRIKGNSTRMAQWLLEAAQEAGATVTEHRLNELSYRGCQSCWHCKGKSEVCVLDDDLAPVLADVAAADALVMSTPIYYGDVASQLKGFIDRTFSYLRPRYYQLEEKSRLTPGKKMIMVIAQGKIEEEEFADVYPRYERFFQWMGFTHARPFRACGVYLQGAAEKRAEELRARARELADWLVS